MNGRLRARGLRVACGFTLLEMLVVIVLIALATGLVAPAGARWLNAARERAWQSELRTQLMNQPLRAFQEGRAIQLDAQALRNLVPDIPAGVLIGLTAPLRYGKSGAASAAEIRLRVPGSPELVWRITPVTGEVQG